MKNGDLVRIPNYSNIMLDDYDGLVNRAVANIVFEITDTKVFKGSVPIGYIPSFLLIEKESGIDFEFWVYGTDLELISES